MDEFKSPKMLIIDHYDSMIRQVDIFTEELLSKCNKINSVFFSINTLKMSSSIFIIFHIRLLDNPSLCDVYFTHSLLITISQITFRAVLFVVIDHFGNHFPHVLFYIRRDLMITSIFAD